MFCMMVCTSIKAEIVIQTYDDPAGSRYELILREKNEQKVIWERTIKKSEGGKPDEWCRLVATDQSNDAILVLIERNEFAVELIQFDKDGRLLSSLKTFDPGWLAAERKGHRLALHAPNQVEVSDADGTNKSFLLVNGKIVDENGSAVGTSSSMSGYGAARAERKPSVSDIQPDLLAVETKAFVDSSEPGSLKSPVLLIFVLGTGAVIALAGSLLWILKKRRA